jgi:hypothetical protein
MRHLSSAFLLTFLAGASAAAPPIAFAKNGSGNVDEVWLVNPDGTGAVRVYRGTSKTNVTNVDVRPGGGQVAFIEFYQGSNYRIKVVSYDANGVAQSTTTVPQPAGCVNQGLDFRSDGLLLFSQVCNSDTVLSIDTWDGTTVTPVLANLGQNDTPWQVRWLPDGSGFLWRSTGLPATPQQLRESSLSNPSAWNVLWNIPSTSSAVYIDAANQSSSILVTFAGPPAQVLQYPFDSVSGVGSATLVASGTEGHFSPDDSKIVYRVQTKTGWNLVVKDLSSGSVKTIQTGIGLSEDWGG